MQSITKKAKEQGCICGWDLAHGIGNVPLSLHDWDVDFAVWCTYKYLNSGPGGIAGLYMHEKWDDNNPPKLAGWWGHELDTRFMMPPTFSPIRGAQGFQQSNPCILATASLLGSLQVFKEADFNGLNILCLHIKLQQHIHRAISLASQSSHRPIPSLEAHSYLWSFCHIILAEWGKYLICSRAMV